MLAPFLLLLGPFLVGNGPAAYDGQDGPVGAGEIPVGAGEIEVKITGLRNAKGMLRACLTAHEKSFPDCSKDPDARRAQASAAMGGLLRFRGVKPGRYAISVLHDENANGKADRVLGMIPREGFGFSRDAPVRTGPPDFRDAAFDFDGSGRRLPVKMRYLF